jgi:hypothetical protein
VLPALDIPSMQTTIPITAVHCRNAYPSAATKALFAMLTVCATSLARVLSATGFIRC